MIWYICYLQNVTDNCEGDIKYQILRFYLRSCKSKLVASLSSAVKSAWWAPQGMTTQKMDFQEPKLTTKGPQRHEQNAKYVCMFVYNVRQMYMLRENAVISGLFYFTSGWLIQHVNVYFKSCLRFWEVWKVHRPGSFSPTRQPICYTVML